MNSPKGGLGSLGDLRATGRPRESNGIPRAAKGSPVVANGWARGGQVADLGGQKAVKVVSLAADGSGGWLLGSQWVAWAGQRAAKGGPRNGFG